MRRFIRACLSAAGLGLFAAVAAFAQDAPPPAASTPSASASAIVLPADGGAISLDARSRYWIDPTGIRTAAQLDAAADSIAWAPRETGHSYNIDGKALWFEFEAANAGDRRWFLQVGGSGIDRVQFFYRGADGQWISQEAGDTKAVSQWPLPGRFPTFELSALRQTPVRYWVRVEHARVDFAYPMALYDQSSLLASREREQLLLGAYFGLAGLITLVSLANAIGYRDRNFVVYATYVAALAIGQLAYLGVGAQHIWEPWLRWNAMATFILPGISAAAALWFARTVTEPARFSKALDQVVWGLIIALLAAVAIDTALQTRSTFAAMMLLTLSAVGVVAVLIGLVWIKGNDPYIRLIALGFLPVLVMALFPLARSLNLIPASMFTRYGLSIGAVMEMPILFYALSLRGNRRRESQVRASALSSNDVLTGLAHSRTLIQRLDSALARARNLKHACALMAVKVSNLDAIVSEHGRETADAALVVAASLLRNAITDIDLAARVGEQDFALLLEGPTTTENAMSRAQQVVAAGLRSSDALPAGTTLKFFVAVALLPDKDFDASASLKWLLDAVRAMSPAARKLIRALNF
ncbi:MAG: sensor domain-containing diguanylate cyclase [Ramlibacter sp.]